MAANANGSNQCDVCKDYARFERSAPAGNVFKCSGCGKQYRRFSAPNAADRMLTTLLTSPVKR